MTITHTFPKELTIAKFKNTHIVDTFPSNPASLTKVWHIRLNWEDINKIPKA